LYAFVDFTPKLELHQQINLEAWQTMKKKENLEIIYKQRVQK